MRKFNLKHLLIIIGIPLGLVNCAGVTYGLGKAICLGLQNFTTTKFAGSAWEETNPILSSNSISDCFLMGISLLVCIALILWFGQFLLDYIFPKTTDDKNTK